MPTTGLPHIERVIIAAHQPLVRAGLQAALEPSYPATAVTVADNVSDLSRLLCDDREDLFLVMCAEFGQLGGTDGIALVRQKWPHVRLLMVSPDGCRETVLEYLAAGAHGVVPLTATDREILFAARSVAAYHMFMTSSAFERAHPKQALPDAGDEKPVLAELLTKRQLAVMDHVSLGLSNKEIARELGLSESTIKVHVNAIFHALGVHNRVGAINAANALGGPDRTIAGNAQPATKPGPEERRTGTPSLFDQNRFNFH